MTTLPSAVTAWLSEQGHGEVTNVRTVGGGCINNGARLETTSGVSFFLKTNQRAPADMFAREAEGLKALQQPDGPRVPKVFLFGEDFLLLEDLSPAGQQLDYWQQFGRQLAALHAHTSEQFGFDHDNYIGSTPQPNPWMEDGYEFFAEQRLNFQARLASQRGLFSSKEVEAVERMASRLPELVPAQPPSLIHGDLWGGNAISDSQGGPAIIDPATHYGWAEAELGMTVLFGGFGEGFYRAYNEVNRLEPGWKERMEIYYLYHVLNHLNLFGRGYHDQAIRIAKRYGG